MKNVAFILIFCAGCSGAQVTDLGGEVCAHHDGERTVARVSAQGSFGLVTADLEAVVAHGPDEDELRVDLSVLALKIPLWTSVRCHFERFACEWCLGLTAGQPIRCYDITGEGITTAPAVSPSGGPTEQASPPHDGEEKRRHTPDTFEPRLE